MLFFILVSLLLSGNGDAAIRIDARETPNIVENGNKLSTRSRDHVEFTTNSSAENALTSEKYCPSSVMFNEEEFNSYTSQGNLSWSPQPHRFLLEYCFEGRTTNHVKCLRQTALAAILLNRTLLINDHPDEAPKGIDRTTLLDIDRTRRCFGPRTVMLFSEYETLHNGSSVIIDHIACWGRHCFNGEPATNKNFSVGATRMRHVAVDPAVEISDGYIPLVAFTRQLLDAVGSSQKRVMYVGDLSGMRIREYPQICGPLGQLKDIDNCRYLGGFQPLPLTRAASCESSVLFTPPKVIVDAARGLLHELFGESRVLAFHWRRGDFFRFCSAKFGLDRNLCFLPVDVVAGLLAEKAMASNVSHILVISNAKKKSEISGLKSKIQIAMNKTVQIESIGSHGLVEAEFQKKPWAADVMAKYKKWSHSVELSFEKSLCALTFVFVGTPKSSFTHSIEHMRYGLRTASAKDAYICQPYS